MYHSKDHNNSFLQRKVDLSLEFCLSKLQSEVLEEPVVSIQCCDRVARLQAVCPVFASGLQTRAVPALVRAGLQFDAFGLQSVSMPENQPVGKVLAAPRSVYLSMNYLLCAFGVDTMSASTL